MADGSLDSMLFAGLAFFWLGMLGLLWRRSMLGMLVGLLLGWTSVVLVVVGWLLIETAPAAREGSGAIGFCLAIVASTQVVLGLALVVTRVSRSGSLDAEDAELLEG